MCGEANRWLDGNRKSDAQPMRMLDFTVPCGAHRVCKTTILIKTHLMASLCAIPKQGNTYSTKVSMVLRQTNKSPTWACDMLGVSAAKTITDCVGTDCKSLILHRNLTNETIGLNLFGSP
jgi:hypothetical protein